MKTATAILVLVILVFSQTAPGKKPDPVSSLSESFAKTGLIAVNAIDADTSIPEVRGDEILVGGKTQEKIDVADSEAVSKEEVGLVHSMRALYVKKLTNNMQNEISRLQGAKEDEKARSAFTTCFADFESELRKRSPSLPRSCSDILGSPTASK